MSTEVELKVLLDIPSLRRLRANPSLTGMAEAPSSRLRLHARYFDTADGALSRARIALRVRREGRVWVQTAKAGREPGAGLMRVTEVSCPAPRGHLALDALPDEALREAIRAAAGDAPLGVVYETRIEREVHRLASPLGGSVELAIDRGLITAGAASEPIIEAELELKSGDPRDLYAVAERLFPEGPIRFSRRSKAARGAALARGEPAVHPLPPIVHAAAVRLNADQSTESAARDVLRSCHDQIAANVAAAAASDAPEGPHQLRVGLRRLRTALLLFRPVIDGPAAQAIAAEAQDLATVVGALRDLDVLADEVVAPLAGTDPGFGVLGAALDAQRSATRRAVRQRLAEGRTVRFVLGIGAFVEGRGWLRPADFDQSAALAAPVDAFAARAVRRRWRKAEALGSAIDTLDLPARHELRKALKKLRYAAEFTADLWPLKKFEPFLKALKSLQEDFGAMQDVAMARAVLCAPGAPAEADPAAQRAVGYLLGLREAEAARVWARAVEDWRALERAPRFWR
jgi:inorganic triphosphatase YgiF